MKSKTKKEERLKLISRIREKDIGLLLNTVIEIHNSSCVLISGCDRIVDYKPNEIKLSSSKGIVIIKGERLRLEGLVNSQISIIGKIFCVELCDDK